MVVIRVAAVLAALLTPAAFALSLVRLRRRIPRRSWRVIAGVVCLAPLSAPFWLAGLGRPRLPMLIAIMGGIAMIKAVDWFADPRSEGHPVRVWLILTFWPGLEIEDVGVPIPDEHRRIAMLLRRLVAGVCYLMVGLALTAVGQFLALPDRDVWLEGFFKCLEIYLLATGSNHLLVAAFAAAGFRIRDGFRYPILAHSVLDFWSRYNVWIHRWLKKHVFEPIGRRRRRPVVGVLAVFAVSGLLHDYLMVPVAADLLGWQFTFFALHGLGAIGGTWLGRRYRAIVGSHVPRALAVAATLGFVLATAPIFIHCMDRVVDLHRDVGGWVLRMVGAERPAEPITMRLWRFRIVRHRMGKVFIVGYWVFEEKSSFHSATIDASVEHQVYSVGIEGASFVLEIVNYPHPALRYTSRSVTEIDDALRQTVRSMFDLMYAARGIGLAANQVALPFRFFVLNLTADPEQRDHEKVFINPEIVKRHAMIEDEEGCLSLPGLYAQVKRARKIRVRSYDLEGNLVEHEADELFSRAVQHETDHLDGKLFIDYLDPLTLRSAEEKIRTFERAYRQAQRSGEIPQDDELVKRLDAIAHPTPDVTGRLNGLAG